MKVGSLSTLTYTYNNANQPTAITQGTSSVGFDYDATGRPKTLTLPDGIVQTYGYDDANELTSIAYTKGTTTLGDLAYGYDGAGRRTAAWGSYARTGLPLATSATASYNADNQLASWNGTSLTYDPNGNLTGFGSQTYTWNDRNQQSATSGGSASFAYDGLGRRLSKTVGATTTKFLYDGANVVQEQNSSNTATANLLTGLGIDQTFSRSVVGGATSSLLTDALGSTIALADANGAVQTPYTYDPFGAVTVSGATSTNSYQFTGRENDGSAGLYFYRARYYNPAISRFISEDPLGFPGGPDPNLYAYVGNDPTVADPFGLDPGNGCGFLGWSCIVRAAGNVFRFARNVPFTTAGYLWGEFNGGDCHWGAGLVVVCTEVNGWANGPRSILTIGNVILAERKTLTEAEFEHESGHVDQWAIFQAALPQLYGGAEIISQTLGRGPCWNVFERWAGFSAEVYPDCLA